MATRPPQSVRPFLAALLTGALAACGGGDATGPEPPPEADPPESPDPPQVTLGAAYDYPGSEGRDSLRVANGEEVRIRWSVTGDPTACRAAGDWFGDVACSDTVEVVGPFQGPDTLDFRLEVENEAGTAVDSASVAVGVPGQAHVRSDRPDDRSDQQFHVLYVVPSDRDPRPIDLDGRIAAILETSQRWLEDRIDGRRIRLDTHQGNLDITFFRLSASEDSVEEDDGGPVVAELRDAFQQAGKKYLIFYDGEVSHTCGEAGIVYASVYLRGGEGASCGDDIPSEPREPGAELDEPMAIALHEMAHALGAVDEDAPHHNEADHLHVRDDPNDLMYSPAGGNPPRGPTEHFDAAEDDYYGANVPDGVTNLEDSVFLFTP